MRRERARAMHGIQPSISPLALLIQSVGKAQFDNAKRNVDVSCPKISGAGNDPARISLAEFASYDGRYRCYFFVTFINGFV